MLSFGCGDSEVYRRQGDEPKHRRLLLMSQNNPLTRAPVVAKQPCYGRFCTFEAQHVPPSEGPIN